MKYRPLRSRTGLLVYVLASGALAINCSDKAETPSGGVGGAAAVGGNDNLNAGGTGTGSTSAGGAGTGSTGPAAGGDSTVGGSENAGGTGSTNTGGSEGDSGGSDSGTCQTAGACPAEGDTCATQAGCCVCEVIGPCGDEAQWSCIEPSTDPGCGSVPPEAGTACSSSGLECNYCIQERPAGASCSFAGEWLETNGFRNCR